MPSLGGEEATGPVLKTVIAFVEQLSDSSL
jgi:hypothetical protein